ncbi:MAG TPA: heavy metal translocating P-type ATPase [Woeseiaceae bacterium]|nr:heavy metal translocating P-type ATPase [Woeseiaceae bacterium]
MTSRRAGLCFHCGEPLPAGAPVWARLDDVTQPVCCAGCKAVAEFIHEQALGAYYEHRRAPKAAAGLKARAADWSAYDDPDLALRYLRRDGDIAEAVVDIGGMYCSACAWLLESGLGRVAGVRSVALNPATRRAVITWDASQLAFSALLARIAALGFSPAPAVPGAADAHRADEQRQALRRLIVAAAAGMQVMMFAVALYAGDYFGIEGRIETFLRVTSLLVCLPVVFYSARPFFAGAVRGVRRGRPGMDLPVSLAIAAAFLASTYAALRGVGEIYFDSVAMFVLFLGAARYLEMRARHGAEDGVRAMAALLPDTATRLAGDVPEVVATDRLRSGDRVLIRPGDVIPADGCVVSGELSIDEALLTGESMPVARGPGAEVFAGGINRAGMAAIEVERVGACTGVAEIGRMIERAKADRPPIALFADRIAGRFVLGVIAIAGVAGLAWLPIDGRRAFEVMLATLVVTCPCALSLATPATLAAAASRLGRQGILLVRARVLDVFSRPANIVFDKTGTLSEGRPAITDVHTLADVPARECLAWAGAMEALSEHVLARAFTRGHTVAGATAVVLDDAAVVAGRGVEATIATMGGRRLRLGSLEFVSLGFVSRGRPSAPAAGPAPDAASLVWLADEERLLARFTLEDPLRADAVQATAALAARGHRLSIASGDRDAAVRAAAARLGIADWHAGLTPAGKLDWLSARRRGDLPVIMVGDGVNDAPVLAAADASIAVDAGTALARASADVVVPGRRLASVVEIADTAVQTRRVIAQNIAWAIGYNLCAVPLAVSGLLAPWMAAIGMSLSSLLVVGNALRLERSPHGRRPVPAEAPPAADAVREALT